MAQNVRFWRLAANPFFLVIISLYAGIRIYDRIFPFEIPKVYSTQIKDENGDLLYAFLSEDEKWRMYATSGEITPLLKKTFLFKEDKYFFYHPGINPVAITRALATNLLQGKTVSGASTITMQVVRMLHPRPRTYNSKLIEIWNAFRLERARSKDEILQLYFNLIPFGGNIEGVRAASMLYFGKPPRLLSLAEITTLTVIPNNPGFLNPRNNPGALLQERDKWLKRFLKKDLFAAESVNDALSEPLHAYRREAPKKAPHLAFRLKRQFPDEHLIIASIDQSVQSKTEMLVKNYVNRIRSNGIHNASVLVLDNKTLKVAAYVGSADFQNAFDGGQVDGIRAVRSPGSTLKPFLYATVFDKGFCIPKTIINDVPANFDGYEPENFDRKYKGPVSVEFALANSLNIPAVKLLKQLEVSAMTAQLKKAGFRTVEKQAGELGLSLILGGCGATLEELTRLFSVFARDGLSGALNFTQESEKAGPDASLISEESAYMVTKILSRPDRPDLPNNFDYTYRLPRIAWKTGTSYGKRDAWSIGYNRRFTVGVWVGNFSGQGVPELSGANTATPLLFEIFNSIDYNAPGDWFEPPEKLDYRQVCSHTGDVPGPECREIVISESIAGTSAFKRCEHLRPVFTDRNEKISYCAHCLPAGEIVKKSYPNLAPELIAFYKVSRIPFVQIPVHNPACDRVFADGPPVIVSPSAGVEYFLYSGSGSELQLMCQAARDVSQVTWLVNDRILKKAPPGEAVFIKPPPGVVKISCADDKGRNSDVVIYTRRL